MASRRPLFLLSVALVLGCAATAHAAPSTGYASFLAALQADRMHHLLMLNAASKDAATTALLQQPSNVTAFVPTDAAFVKAATSLKGAGNVTMAKLLASPCVVRAILNYHTIRPGLTLTQLCPTAANATTATTTKPTLFKARTVVAGKAVLAPRYLKATRLAGGQVRVAGGATSGTVTSPSDVVIAGGGVAHNIDTLLLPTTNLTRLLEITGCTL